jgi:hypothetical protein
VSNSFEKLIAMPTHDSGTLKIDGTVLMDSSDGTADAGDHIVQNTSANENDNILLEDGMHDPVGVLSSHGVTLSGTTFTATGLSAGATTLSSTLAVTGAITASSTFTGGGLMTTGGNIVIPNAGNIGSVGDTDAIAIASNGVVTFSQNPVFPDGGIAIADLDIDGASDIGADLASTDLIIVDDGAGGTNRKAALSRVVTLTDAGATALAIALG